MIIFVVTNVFKMDRKDFLRKTLLGSSMLVSSVLNADLLKNDIDELHELEAISMEQVGFIPIIHSN